MDITSLNDMQKKAVTCTEGPLLVLAGAGSGKTRVLTYRIAYMIKECGISPYNILALTFTNKAAREMRERTELLIGSSAKDMWVSTFHSACAKILRIDGDKIGIDKGFTIYDDSERRSVIAPIMERMGIDENSLNKSAVLHIISDAKNRSTNPVIYLREEYRSFDDKLVGLYKAYEKAMRTANALDFDDLILMVIKLLRDHPEMLEKYRKKFAYVLVDEYQDTNMPQYELVHLLCEEHGNICVVGDDDQSIYAWRGADIRNILEFEKDFPGTDVIRLEQNYRSSGNILDAANAVIDNNRNRKGKKLWTAAGGGAPIIHYTAYDERDEANFICHTVLRAIDRGASCRDHAVLYRTNAQSRVLESALMSYGIKYKVFGGQRFYERMEVRDVMAYLRLIANPNDDAAFKRIVNVPPRGIGDKSLQTLEGAAYQNGLSLLGVLQNPMLFSLFTPAVQKKFLPFAAMYEELSELKKQNDVASLAQQLIMRTGYLDYLSKYDGEFESRCQNIDELIGVITEIEEGLEQGEDALSLFLENAALATDMDNDDEGGDYVSLMTLHSAKGLEYHTVFIAGMEENLFPGVRALETADKMEEERRLCYVGITRARKKLYLLNAESRRLYNRPEVHRPSRFLEEIPPHLMHDEGIRKRYYSFEDEYTYSSDRSGGSMYSPRNTSAAPLKQQAVHAVKREAPPKPNKNPAADKLDAGSRVRHATFGDGLITAKSGSGNSAIVTVIFDDGSTKKLAAAFAPLSIISEE